MSYLTAETTAWVDPYLLSKTNAHLFDEDDEEQRRIKEKLTTIVKRRDQESIKAAGAVPAPEQFLHPVDFGGANDKNAAQYFTHVAVSNSTVVAVTKNNMIHFFDQSNDIPITCMTLIGSTPAGPTSIKMELAKLPGLSTQSSTQTNYVDAKDWVVKLFIDPMGRHCVVTFQTGVSLMFHIKKAVEEDQQEGTKDEKKKKKNDKKAKQKAEERNKPQRFDVVITPEISQTPSFAIESIAWDEHNEYESSTGEVLLGSQKYGALVSCRFEAGGLVAPRHVFTFPTPFNRSPIHSMAMYRELEGRKRYTIFVAMDHRLFFFQGQRTTIESAFQLSALHVPDTEAELAYSAVGGTNSGLPLKNFWSLPVVAPTAAGSGNAPPSVAKELSSPISRVVILSPHPKYKTTQMPPTIAWTYHDTLVQGVLLPDANDDGLPSSGSPTVANNKQSTRTRLRTITAGSRSTEALQVEASKQSILDAMRSCVRILSVTPLLQLIGATEYALQFDTTAQAPTFAPSGSKGSLGAVPRADWASPTGTTGMLAKGSNSQSQPPPSMHYVIQERIQRVTVLYFYLIVATQTKMYIFASPSFSPLPPVSNPWDIRNRMVLQYPLMTLRGMTEPYPSTVTSFPASAQPPAPLPPGLLKFPTGANFLYKVPDSCLEIHRDRRSLGKVYLCVAKDIYEIQLPPMRRQFAVLLAHTAAQGASSTHSMCTGNALELLPFSCPLTVGDYSATTAVRRTEPSVSVRGRAPAVSAMQTASKDSKIPTYTTQSVMRSYGASRFPLMQHYRHACLTPDSLFQMARALAQGMTKLSKEIEDTYGEWLFRNGRYIEAAARLGKYSREGVDVLFQRFAQLKDSGPLLLFCLTRVKAVNDAGRAVSGQGMIEVSCLSSASLVLLFDRCNAHARAKQKEFLSAFALSGSAGQQKTDTAGSLPATALEKLHNLHQPQVLLAALLSEQRELLPWSVTKEALFSVASEPEVLRVCRALDQYQELLRFLLSHERHFEALQMVIERSKQEADEGSCYDEEGYVHSGIAAHLWESYGGVFMQHYPVRMIRLAWIPYGSDVGLDALRLLPILSRYDPKNNETQLEANGKYDDVVGYLARRQERAKLLELRQRLLASSDKPDDIPEVIDENDNVLQSEAAQVTDHMGIIFLKHLVGEGYTEQALSNMLLQFLARSGSDSELNAFISESKSLDLQYALRVCHAHDRVAAVIHIYFALGHLHQAIELALKSKETTLAKQLVMSLKEGCPGAGDNPSSTRRELWRMIVEHVAKQQFGPKNALHLISESSNDVDVSHVIPNLSDEVMLSEFKTELLENVAEFGKHMKEVKQAIEKSKSDVEMLRGDVLSEWRSTLKVNVAKKCDACGLAIWGHGKSTFTNIEGDDPVFYKGCSHAFHMGCLYDRWKACPGGVNIDDWDMEEYRERCIGQECFLCAPVALQYLLRAPLRGAEGSIELPL